MFPPGPKSFKFTSVKLITRVITDGEEDHEKLKKNIFFHKHSDLSLILLTSVASVRSVLAS